MRKQSTLFVLSGTYQQALNFAKSRGLKTRKDYIYIDSRRRLEGIRGAMFVKYGTYYERRDLADILQILSENQFKEVNPDTL